MQRPPFPIRCRFGHGLYSSYEPVCPACAKIEEAAREKAKGATSPQRTGPEQEGVPLSDAVNKSRDPRWWASRDMAEDYRTGVYGDVGWWDTKGRRR